MADVQDILNLSRGASTPKSSKKSSTPKAKRPDGMSREVFALTGGLPSIVAKTPPLAGLKDKRKIKDKKVSWQWVPFTNSARTDGAVFHHWRKSDEKATDYYFAKFNKTIDVPKYTEEQYQTYFQDPAWTKEETDALFDLCSRFDLRFVVIADRFPYPNKQLEDLKDRYFTITRKLIELKTPGKDNSQNPLFKAPYDKAQDIERRKQWDKLDARTKAQADEEETLALEYKRIEAARQAHHKDREYVEKITQSALSSATVLSPSNRPLKRRKVSTPKKGSTKAEPSTPRISPRPPPPVSPKVASKVDLVLKELNIGVLSITTPAICKTYNELRQDIVVLLDLQSHMQKKEYELRLLRAQKENMEKEQEEKKANGGEGKRTEKESEDIVKGVKQMTLERKDKDEQMKGMENGKEEEEEEEGKEKEAEARK